MARDKINLRLQYVEPNKLIWLMERFGMHIYLEKKALSAADGGSIWGYKKLLEVWLTHLDAGCTDEQCITKFNNLTADLVQDEADKGCAITENELVAGIRQDMQDSSWA
jgi:hypothetical protein